MMLYKDNNLVWYACYGSNLLRERFLQYILGCTDTTEPIEDRPYILQHRLYFGGMSRWGGGAAFVETQLDKTVTTYGRIYKITKEQLDDILPQEGKSDRWYGNIMLLGTVDGLPVYTLTRTSQYDRYDLRQPTDDYLKVIEKGLVEIYPYLDAKSYLSDACVSKEH